MSSPLKLPDTEVEWLHRLLASFPSLYLKATKLLTSCPEWPSHSIPCRQLNHHLYVTHLKLTCDITIITVKMLPPPQPVDNSLQGVEIGVVPGRSPSCPLKRFGPPQGGAPRKSSPTISSRVRTPPRGQNASSPVPRLPAGTPPIPYANRPLPKVPGARRRSKLGEYPSRTQSAEPYSSPQSRPSQTQPAEGESTAIPRKKGRPISLGGNPKFFNSRCRSNGNIISPQPQHSRGIIAALAISDSPPPQATLDTSATKTADETAVEPPVPRNPMVPDIFYEDDDFGFHYVCRRSVSSADKCTSARPLSYSELSIHSEESSEGASERPLSYTGSNNFSLAGDSSYGYLDEASDFERWYNDSYDTGTPLAATKLQVPPSKGCRWDSSNNSNSYKRVSYQGSTHPSIYEEGEDSDCIDDTQFVPALVRDSIDVTGNRLSVYGIPSTPSDALHESAADDRLSCHTAVTDISVEYDEDGENYLDLYHDTANELATGHKLGMLSLRRFRRPSTLTQNENQSKSSVKLSSFKDKVESSGNRKRPPPKLAKMFGPDFDEDSPTMARNSFSIPSRAPSPTDTLSRTPLSTKFRGFVRKSPSRNRVSATSSLVRIPSHDTDASESLSAPPSATMKKMGSFFGDAMGKAKRATSLRLPTKEKRRSNMRDSLSPDSVNV